MASLERSGPRADGGDGERAIATDEDRQEFARNIEASTAESREQDRQATMKSKLRAKDVKP